MPGSRDRYHPTICFVVQSSMPRKPRGLRSQVGSKTETWPDRRMRHLHTRLAHVELATQLGHPSTTTSQIVAAVAPNPTAAADLRVPHLPRTLDSMLTVVETSTGWLSPTSTHHRHRKVTGPSETGRGLPRLRLEGALPVPSLPKPR